MTVPVSQIRKLSLSEQVPGLVTQRDLNSGLADQGKHRLLTAALYILEHAGSSCYLFHHSLLLPPSL